MREAGRLTRGDRVWRPWFKLAMVKVEGAGNVEAELSFRLTAGFGVVGIIPLSLVGLDFLEGPCMPSSRAAVSKFPHVS